MASLRDDEAPDDGLDAPLLERPSFRRLSSTQTPGLPFMGGWPLGLPRAGLVLSYGPPRFDTHEAFS